MIFIKDKTEDCSNTINIKRYVTKVAKGENTQDYWIPKEVFNDTFYATIYNLSMRTNIGSYIGLILTNENIQPLYLVKNVIESQRKRDFINLKDYIKTRIAA